MSWRATVLTIFPEMLPGPLAHSLAGKALAAGIWLLETVDIRDFARDKHRSVDDAPFGGGPGMIMRPDVVDAAIAGAGEVGPLIHLSPRGKPLDQQRVRQLSAGPGVRLFANLTNETQPAPSIPADWRLLIDSDDARFAGRGRPPLAPYQLVLYEIPR